MSDYAYLLEQLRKAEAAVSELEAALSREPGDPALEVDLLSAKRSARVFQEELLSIAPTKFFDVCRYRIVATTDGHFGIDGITGSLQEFQNLFRYVFYAITSRRPLKAARIPSSVERESQLHIAYTFAGSLGVVLTIDSSKTLFDTRFDDTVTTLFNLIEIQDQADVKDNARKLGVAVVRQAYEWARKNYEAAYEIDLRWRNTNLVEKGRYIERSDFGRIADSIGFTSDTTREIIAIDGLLAGGDLLTKKFHIVDDEDNDYRGSLSGEFVAGGLELGGRYRVRMLKETVLRYASEDEECSYTLLGLDAKQNA